MSQANGVGGGGADDLIWSFRGAGDFEEIILDLSRSLSWPVPLHTTPPPVPYKRGLPQTSNLTFT